LSCSIHTFCRQRGGNVFLTTNNGTSWTNVSQGLTHLSIKAIAIKGGYKFAGGDNTGVWRRPLTEMTGIMEWHI